MITQNLLKHGINYYKPSLLRRIFIGKNLDNAIFYLNCAYNNFYSDNDLTHAIICLQYLYDIAKSQHNNTEMVYKSLKISKLLIKQKLLDKGEFWLLNAYKIARYTLKDEYIMYFICKKIVDTSDKLKALEIVTNTYNYVKTKNISYSTKFLYLILKLAEKLKDYKIIENILDILISINPYNMDELLLLKCLCQFYIVNDIKHFKTYIECSCNKHEFRIIQLLIKYKYMHNYNSFILMYEEILTEIHFNKNICRQIFYMLLRSIFDKN